MHDVRRANVRVVLKIPPYIQDSNLQPILENPARNKYLSNERSQVDEALSFLVRAEEEYFVGGLVMLPL